MIDVNILGTSGTYPFVNRAFSTAIARINGKAFLFDCGEGTQIQLQKTVMSAYDIEYILISHLHADHISGLFGLLLTMKENGRTKPVTIIGPDGIQDFVECMFRTTMSGRIPINFIEIPKSVDSLEIAEGNIVIKAARARHSVPCFAYSVELLRKPKFKPEVAIEKNLPVSLWSKLANGEDVEFEGEIFNHSEFLGPERKGIKLSYVTDTRPTHELRDFVSGSDLAIVEGMFREDEKLPDAKKKKHMTWRESASLVKDNDVKEAILTHYSPSLTINFPDDEMFAKALSPNLTVGFDGLTRDISFTE